MLFKLKLMFCFWDAFYLPSNMYLIQFMSSSHTIMEHLLHIENIVEGSKDLKMNVFRVMCTLSISLTVESTYQVCTHLHHFVDLLKWKKKKN